jgi:ParB/RepB/Spo0J family partition protein
MTTFNAVQPITVPTTPDTVIEVALADLHDSPFQPRTTYLFLQALAENIAAEGRIHSPLVVRPRRPNPLRDDVTDGFEVVFGHRRKRAAELAGLATAPCIVRDMSDAEVRSAQMSENLQREGMLALEEAAGFRQQIDADGLSASELARRIGKSPSFVCGRLKLLTLHPTVRTALVDGDIEAESALLVARVGPPALQEKALAAIASANLDSDLKDGGRRSYRSVRNLLNERFTLELDKALFDREDATLAPLAGACSSCPKRSGNAPEFSDLVYADPRKDRYGMHVDFVPHKGADVCTDPDCFTAKKEAHLQRQADALRAAGKQVIVGNKARAAIDAQGHVKGAFIAASEVKAELKPVNGMKPQPVTIQDPRGGKTVQAYRREDLQAHGVKVAAAKPSQGTAAHYEAERRKRVAEQEANEAKAEAENRMRRAMLAKVREAVAARPRSEFDLRIIAGRLFGASTFRDQQLLAELHGFKSADDLGKKLGQLDLPALNLFVLDCALVDELEAHHWNLKQQPENLLVFAAHYGVDLNAVRRDLKDSSPTPSPAAQAKTKAPTKTAAGAGKAVGKVKYRCPDTLMTWSGRGLQPAWLKAALARGKTLAELECKDQTDKARKAGQKVKDGAGVAGEVDRDPNTADMFEVAAP